MLNSTKKFAVAIAATATLGLLQPAAAQDKDPIIIGAAIALSGIAAPFDGDPSRAAEIAVSEINAAGGVLGRPLKIIYADTKSDFAHGAVAGEQVLDRGADIVIVTGDFDFGGGAARAANARKVIAISPFAADPKFGVRGIGPYAFTFATASVTSGALLAEFAVDQGWKTAYTLTQNTIQYDQSVTRAFRERFEELAGAGSLLGKDVFAIDDASIASQITRIKNLSEQPDVLLLSSFTPAGPAALRQIRAAGIDIPVVSAEDMDGDYWHASVPNLSNFFYVAMASIYGDGPDERVNALLKKFQDKHGGHPSTAHTITGYDVIYAVALAIERAGSTDGDAIKAEFEKFRDEQMLGGPTSFDSTRHINFKRPMVIMQVKDGEPSYVETRLIEKVPTTN